MRRGRRMSRLLPVETVSGHEAEVSPSPPASQVMGVASHVEFGQSGADVVSPSMPARCAVAHQKPSPAMRWHPSPRIEYGASTPK